MAFNVKNHDSSHPEDSIMAEINMTPLIDIMLVLLIIFMVTSSISLESGLDIDIPTTSSRTKTQEGDAVIVSLDRSGNISVQGGRLGQNIVNSLEEFKKTISNALSEAHTKSIIFEGDTTATLGKMIEIMDIAKSAGAEKFSIAANTK